MYDALLLFGIACLIFGIISSIKKEEKPLKIWYYVVFKTEKQNQISGFVIDENQEDAMARLNNHLICNDLEPITDSNQLNLVSTMHPMAVIIHDKGK